jgi:hypothetical protein
MQANLYYSHVKNTLLTKGVKIIEVLQIASEMQCNMNFLLWSYSMWSLGVKNFRGSLALQKEAATFSENILIWHFIQKNL